MDASPTIGDMTRTDLAAERTWLAWWRTGLTATAAGVGVGRLLPEVTGGTHWPYVVLGAGYACVGLGLMVAGGVRQARIRNAVRRGAFNELGDVSVAAFTVAGALLTLATLAALVAGP